MYLFVEENVNCPGEERVFAPTGPRRMVDQVHIEKPGGDNLWCEVVSVDQNAAFGPATAQQVEDSSDGIAWLIMGGPWGLRFRPVENAEEWSLSNPNQWGAPFLVLDRSGTSLRLKN